MRTLFLHGWKSVPGGRKPTYLKDHGHDVLNPALPDDDFEQSVAIAQSEFDQHQPDIVVGSSRGGAVALNIDSGDVPLVLLCPAWKKWGSAKSTKPETTILHSRDDVVIPFADSEELIANSGLHKSALIEIGNDHRLADPEPLAKMLELCERPSRTIVDVTVFHLEMLSRPSNADVSPPRGGLEVVHLEEPSVEFYRFLYSAVGKDYYWLSRRKLSDDQLAEVLHDPQNELYVLKANGTPAGMSELDCHDPDDIELVQFGLVPEFIGMGLGKWFLQWAIDKVWSRQPTRFWLHTCTLDHPAAVPTYLKAGFVEFQQEQIKREL